MAAERIIISPVNMQSRAGLGMRAGDTVSVHQKIEERGKTRIQAFEGLVLTRKHGNEPGATFTVRKVSHGIGVEKIFPLYSPMIDKITITRRAKMRRAKLYYIREKIAREIKRQMRRMQSLRRTTEVAPVVLEAEAEADRETMSEAEVAPSEEAVLAGDEVVTAESEQ